MGRRAAASQRKPVRGQRDNSELVLSQVAKVIAKVI